jgi:hypothetical protein
MEWLTSLLGAVQTPDTAMLTILNKQTVNATPAESWKDFVNQSGVR